MFHVVKGIVISEKGFSRTNYERLKKSFGLHKETWVLMGSDGNMYLTVAFLIEIVNIVTGSYNITLRKVNANLYGFDKMYMDKELIENKLYQIIDQFNERKITL